MYDGIFNSKNNDDGDKKVPKGFEKFLRKANKKDGEKSKEVEGSQKDDKKDVKKE
jgi:hypothetical protein